MAQREAQDLAQAVLSDTLGFSMLVVAIEPARGAAALGDRPAARRRNFKLEPSAA